MTNSENLSDHNVLNIHLIGGIVAGLLVLLIAVAYVFMVKRRRSSRNENDETKENDIPGVENVAYEIKTVCK